MNLVSGDMLWTNIEKIPNKFTYLSEDIECDVLIIGGGITGAITAYYLTSAGINTTMVDKNIIGYGSTRASTSILEYEIDTDLIELRKIIGEENAVKSFKLCEKAVYDMEEIIADLGENCDFSLQECLYYANNPSYVNPLRKECDIRKKYGFNIEFIEKEQGEKMFSFPFQGGIYSKSGAAQINPYRFTQQLITKAIERGLTVYENTEISKIDPNNDHVILKTNNDYNIRCKKVIIATGYEGKNYIDRKIVDLYRTFTLVTKPIQKFNGWHNKCIIRDNNDPYIYLRTTGDNRIIIGGEDEKIGNCDSKIANITNDHKASKLKYTMLEETLKAYFPDIKNIEIEYKFNGLFGLTKDALPYIGEYEKLPNCYFNLGYGANGILYGVIGGQLIRDLCLGHYRSELELFKFNR